MSVLNSQAGGSPPVHAIRKHSLKASIWKNETRNGSMYNVTLIRTYKDGEHFKDTASIGFDDLCNAAKILLDAESWIAEQLLREKAQVAPEPAREPEPPPNRRAAARRGNAIPVQT